MGKWAENLFGIHEALGLVPSPVETRYNGAHWELLGGVRQGTIHSRTAWTHSEFKASL